MEFKTCLILEGGKTAFCDAYANNLHDWKDKGVDRELII